MGSAYDLYTKIFLDTDMERKSVIDIVSKVVGGSVSHSAITAQHADMFIFNNEDFSEEKRNQEPDGFLFYRYYLEIEPRDGVEDSHYIDGIAKLLTGLWDNGLKAVASCDFEDELPRKGGYNFERRQN